MSLDIGSALRNAAERTIKRNGLIIVGLLFGVSLLSNIWIDSLTEKLISSGVMPATQNIATPLAIGLPSAISGFLALITTILGAIVTVSAIRTFVSSETEIVPRENFTRNIVMALLNLAVGGLVFALVVGLGLIAFIIPGLFLLVSLYFWNVFVIVEDQNFIQGFKSSWGLTQGSRLELFGLGIIVAFLSLIIGGIGALAATLIEVVSLPALGVIVELVPNAVISAFSMATLAQAYNQLRE